jgi:hypothetical protein
MTGEGAGRHPESLQGEGHQRRRLGLADRQQLVQLPRRLGRADVGGQTQQIIGPEAARGNDHDQRPPAAPLRRYSQGGIAHTVECFQRRATEFLYEDVHTSKLIANAPRLALPTQVVPPNTGVHAKAIPREIARTGAAIHS